MTIKVLGIDLGKRYFHIHGVDSAEILVIRKKLKRKELLLFLSNLEPCLIGMKAIVLNDVRGRRLLKMPGLSLITTACLLS